MNSTIHPPEKTGLTIAEVAFELGNRFGIYNSEGRADVGRLAVELGGQVRIENIPSEPNRLMAVYAERDFKISVPSNVTFRNDRYYVARGIGHYFMHYLLAAANGEAPQTYFTKSEKGKIGDQAHVFAHGLLLPETEFRAAATTDGRLRSLMEVFDIGETVVRRRAEFLSVEVE